MIDKLATKLGRGLSIYINLDNKREIELIYFLKRIIKNLIFYITTFTLASSLNIILPVLVILLSYNCVRLRFGGIHLKNQILCLITSVLIPLILGYVASTYDFDLYLIIMIYSVMIVTAYFVGVVDNVNRPLTVEKKQRFKKQGLLIMTILFVLNICIYLIDLTLISNSILLGMLLGVILLIQPRQILE